MDAIKDISKKTKNIVTAIYMVSDYVDEKEPIRNELRTLSLIFLSDINKLNKNISGQGHKNISETLNTITNIITLVDIALTLRMVSLMNSSIIKNELDNIAKKLTDLVQNNHIESMSVSTLVIPEKFFKDEETSSILENSKKISGQVKSHISAILNKENKMSLSINNGQSLQEKKNERRDKIISVIKNNDVNGGLIIKDITSKFVGLSEKTIQRELTELLHKGQIKKTGEKRWSRYYSV